jgi:esterase/lipase
MILYNKTIAKKELNKVKKDAKETVKRLKKDMKQIINGLDYLEFETDLHEKYGDDYTFNEREKNNMLEIYKAKKHLNNILNKIRHDLVFETNKINRDISYYIDENNKLTDWSRDYYIHYGVKKDY